jgi:murein DD-endopeptidase MepM/ murein hydrolase activator NlpD
MGNAQLRLDTLRWIPPVDIPIFLSGNFAELRTGHLHAGIDIKTQGKEGFKVYAVQDGYISRIKVSSGGYGNAIYITHPDGYTSVYAHLKEYNIHIAEYVRNKQYELQKFEVNIFPQKNELQVKQGDVIGLTGNTGSSAGPHLHFEIRDSRNSHPMNGLFLGYDIKDNIAPIMEYLYIYPQSKNSCVNGKNIPQSYKLTKRKGKYVLQQGDTLKVKGSIGIGLKVNDYLNGSGNRCGVYKMEAFENNNKFFQDKFDGISFNETRYVNSLMDYGENVNRKRKLYKLYVEPNNKLSIYSDVVNRGVLDFAQNSVKKIEINTYDTHFNKSTLVFYVEYDDESYEFEQSDKKTIVIPWQQNFILDTMGVVVRIDKNSLYDTLRMEFSVDTTSKTAYYSPVYHIHNKSTAIHKYFNLTITPHNVDDSLKNKILLAIWNKKKYESVGGEYKDGVVSARVRKFGTYTVLADTVPPEIEPVGALKGADLGGENSISLKIYDNLSGIKSYSGTINGEWVLFAYDAKNDMITYTIDNYMPQSDTVELYVEVVDNKDNVAKYTKRYTIQK